MDFRLADLSVAVGVAHAIVGAGVWMHPDGARRLLERFPRSVWPARGLTALALFWVAAIVHGAALGRFEFLKPWLYVAAPAAGLAIVFLMDELLAPRALGGLLLLAAQPLLLAARLHPAAASRGVTVLAYLWVAAGMVLVMAPWQFRRAVERVNRAPAGWRACGAAFAAVGAALCVLGLTVYR